MRFLFASFIALAASVSAHRDHKKSRLNTRASAVVQETCSDSGTAAMTFDDGPYIYLGNILDEFASANAKASFFFNGNNYDCIYDQAENVKRAFNEGHLIGSHTWSHADITTLSVDQLNEELEKLEVAFEKILGIHPTWFRPPYGNINDQALEVLGQRGYKVVTWSMDAGDALGVPADESIQRFNDASKQYPTPQITLDHETTETTSTEVVPAAIKSLTGAGYKLETVNTCLAVHAPYRKVGEPGTKDSTWVC